MLDSFIIKNMNFLDNHSFLVKIRVRKRPGWHKKRLKIRKITILHFFRFLGHGNDFSSLFPRKCITLVLVMGKQGVKMYRLRYFGYGMARIDQNGKNRPFFVLFHQKSHIWSLLTILQPRFTQMWYPIPLEIHQGTQWHHF